MNKTNIPKDDENEIPIPAVWRDTFKQIVAAFVQKDYSLSKGISSVAPVSKDTANQIRDYIADYGEELVALPDETWNSSVCIWYGENWNALIDLWTAGEGRSDMVLEAQVCEKDDGYDYHVYMVFVP